MEYIPQNASGLYLSIQKIGCFFRSALNIGEVISGKALTKEQINKLWDYSKKVHYINDNDDVVSSAGIINLAIKELGGKGRVTEVATFKDGVMNWYRSVTVCRADYYIQKIKQGGPSKTHFWRVDKYGTVKYEPHNPPIKSLGPIHTICYRYDR